MVKVFQGLASQKAIQRLAPGLVIEQAKDYAPDTVDHDYIRRSDAPWIDRFSTAGGVGIISGDSKMRSTSLEREALVQAKLIVFFFEPAWNKLPFCAKCAVILHWWPKILEIAAIAPNTNRP